jgi:hypothetical protein
MHKNGYRKLSVGYEMKGLIDGVKISRTKARKP